MNSDPSTTRPAAPKPIDPRTIPALTGLIPLNRWCGWNYVWKPGTGTKPGKWDKPPCQAVSDDPTTWHSFDDIWPLVQQGTFDGPGFMLLNLPRLAVLDLDDVRDPQTRVLLPWAEQTVRDANTYTEVTPSRCGLRIIGLAPPDLSIHQGKTKHPSGQGAYEIYVNPATGRYITITGHQLRLPEAPR